MQTGIDVRRYSDVLVKKLGRRAPEHAALRAELLLEAGDFDRYAAWKQIVRSVNEHLAQARPDRHRDAVRKEGGASASH
ncbi:MAG: hypothetical protein OEM59_10085 [Rhodospirillales bacterium]|nr:hypothetical protein [Rhodospirillales bacterium]